MLVMVTDGEDAEWDGKEKVIGYLGMACNGGPRPTAPVTYLDMLNSKLNWLEDRYSYYLGLDKSVDYKHLDIFVNSLNDVGPLDAYKEVWELEHLSVHPIFQRRGVGQQLVRAAQRMVAEDKLPLTLIASDKGESMYMKTGFRKVGDVHCGHKSAPALVWTADS